MDYRIEYLGEPNNTNVPVQVITVPCGVKPNILVYTFGDSGFRFQYWIVNGFDNMRIIGSSGVSATPANKPFTPYLPDYMSPRTVFGSKLSITSNEEADVCVYCIGLKPKDEQLTDYDYYYVKLRIQFRNISQTDFFTGTSYKQ